MTTCHLSLPVPYLSSAQVTIGLLLLALMGTSLTASTPPKLPPPLKTADDPNNNCHTACKFVSDACQGACTYVCTGCDTCCKTACDVVKEDCKAYTQTKLGDSCKAWFPSSSPVKGAKQTRPLRLLRAASTVNKLACDIINAALWVKGQKNLCQNAADGTLMACIDQCGAKCSCVNCTQVAATAKAECDKYCNS